MSDYSFLRFLLTEELYLVPDKEAIEKAPGMTLTSADQKEVKKILVINDQPQFASPEFESLSRIFVALKHTIDEVEIVGLDQCEAGMFGQRRMLIVFSFREEKVRQLVGLELEKYVAATHPSGFRVLYSEPLGSYLDDVTKKKRFWEEMKKMFN